MDGWMDRWIERHMDRGRKRMGEGERVRQLEGAEKRTEESGGGKEGVYSYITYSCSGEVDTRGSSWIQLECSMIHVAYTVIHVQCIVAHSAISPNTAIPRQCRDVI